MQELKNKLHFKASKAVTVLMLGTEIRTLLGMEPGLLKQQSNMLPTELLWRPEGYSFLGYIQASLS
jgi:hypothetical protein